MNSVHGRGVRLRLVAALLAVYVLGSTVWASWGPWSDAHRETFGDSAYLPLDIAVVLLAGWSSWRSPAGSRHRKVWFWFALAYGARAWGDISFWWLDGIRHVDAFPSWPDVGFAPSYLLLAVAVLHVPVRGRVGWDRARLLCETVAVIGAGWMLMWFGVLSPNLHQGLPDGFGLALDISYPLGDLALVGCVVGTLLRQPDRSFVASFRPLVLGLVSLTAADVSFDLFTLHPAWKGGQVSNLLWVGALAFAAYAPLCRNAAPRPRRARPPRRSVVETGAYTYAAVIVGLTLLLVSVRHQPSSLLAGLIYGLTAVVGGVLVRQLLALRDTARLAGSLDEALRLNTELSQGLERTVAERTAELASRTLELHVLAHRDGLTGLGNRRVLLQMLHEAAESDRATSLLMLDLDGFKEINDSLGHSTGDALLVGVADRLRAAAGDDGVVRFGGDEFAILLPVTLEEGIALGRRIVESFHEPFAVAQQLLSVGVSVGVAAGTRIDPETLLRDADCAMYYSKRGGTGRVTPYESSMHVEVLHRLRLHEDLRGAIGRGQLHLHYQPTVDLVSGVILGAEALLRWQHPVRGAVSPADFIPLAEETGLICEIGDWVLFEATQAAARWQRLPGGAGIGVAVNVSLRQLSEPGLLETVRNAVAAAGLDAALLTIEITESVLADDESEATRFLAGVRALGVKVALDDFGTGHSSLASLSRYPIDVLKVDKAFIDDMLATDRALHMVIAILRMANSLEFTTLAEGVETKEQAARLRELGCEVAQGFHFARPLPEDQLAIRLAAETRALVPSPR